MKLIEWCCAYFFLIETRPMNYENEKYDEETNQYVTQFNNIANEEEYISEFEEIEENDQETMNDWGFWFKM